MLFSKGTFVGQGGQVLDPAPSPEHGNSVPTKVRNSSGRRRLWESRISKRGKKSFRIVPPTGVQLRPITSRLCFVSSSTFQPRSQ